MKNKLLILCAVILASHCLAQSRVAEISNLRTSNSIVRYWHDNYSVAYIYGPRQANCFLLIDRTTSLVKRIDLPLGTKVNDFRIMHDSVYLGGHVVMGSSGMQGMIACFSLWDAMSGAGNFNYVVMLSSPLSDFWDTPGLYCQVTDVKRIALFEEENRVNVAYIADNYVVGDPIRVGYGWAAYDVLSGSWSSHLMYNKHGREVYTDIIATDDHVVAVGRNSITSKLVMRAYKQIDFIYPSNDPAGYEYLNPKIGQYMLDEDVVSDVMATAIDGGKFAVAYHYSSGDAGLMLRSFSVLGGVANVDDVIASSSVSPSWSQWRMREVCYSPSANSLMVLTDYDCPATSAIESMVFHFPYPMASATFIGLYDTLREIHSITPDPLAVGGFEFSGKGKSVAPFTYGFGQFANNGPCFMQEDIWGIYKVRRTADVEMPTNTVTLLPFSGTLPFVVASESISMICEN